MVKGLDGESAVKLTIAEGIKIANFREKITIPYDRTQLCR